MNHESIWHFGRFSFSVSDNRLKTCDSVQTLPPKQASLLLLFLRNSGRVLSRDKLLVHLWPSVHVGRTSLGVHIAGLRKALGDTAKQAEFIETVSRLGFRFLGSVEQTTVSLTDSIDADDMEPELNPRPLSVRTPFPIQRNAASADRRLYVRGINGMDEAYQLYSMGRRSWRLRTDRSIGQAIACYEKAITLAPSFSLPYIGMADACNYLSMHPGSSRISYRTMEKAKECAYQAIRLNSHSGPAWAALGHAQFTCDWEVQAAEDSYQTAISLDPGYAPAHQWYAWLLLSLGRQAESEREIRYAAQLSEPEPSSKVAFGLHLHCLGHHDLALQQFRSALNSNPEFTPAYRELGRVYEAQGNYPAAIETYGQARTQANRDSEIDAVFAHALTKTGGKQQATQILSDLLKNQSERTLPLYEVAVILVGLGRLKEAVSMLETAWRQRRIWPIWLLFDSRLESLRAELVFQQLMHRFVGLRGRSSEP
jgi:DNA-binding winged helix-turn-helix (wHTH) protein/tetratricopeptide (TPR) repeat protein